MVSKARFLGFFRDFASVAPNDGCIESEKSRLGEEGPNYVAIKLGFLLFF